MMEVEESFSKPWTEDMIELLGIEYLKLAKKTHEEYLRSDNIRPYQLTIF